MSTTPESSTPPNSSSNNPSDEDDLVAALIRMFSAIAPRSEATSKEPAVVDLGANVDERCITFCTQRTNRRAFAVEPRCHTLCWRKVWHYERKLLDATSFPGPVEVRVSIPPLYGMSPNPTEKEKEEAADRRFPAVRNLLMKTAEEANLSSTPPTEDDIKTAEIALRAMEVLFGVKKLFTKESMHEDEETLARLRQLVAQAKDLRNRWIHYPFPPVRTERWSFLRGRYIFYGRSPSVAEGRMTLMSFPGVHAVFAGYAAAMRREGREVSAIIDNQSVFREKLRHKLVGLKQLDDDAYESALRSIPSPKKEMLISLEHVPPMMYDYFARRISRIISPATTLLAQYYGSFVSGQQTRNARALWERVWDKEDGPLGVLRKLTEAAERRSKEIEKEREEKEREAKKGK